MKYVREFVAVGLMLLGLLFLLGFCHCGLLGDADVNARRGVNAMTVKQYKKALDECVAEGKDAGSMAVYETCAKEADLHYGAGR